MRGYPERLRKLSDLICNDDATRPHFSLDDVLWTPTIVLKT